MESSKLIMKCCVCGRVKTDHGWDYEFRGGDDQNVCSHGFCAACYEMEVRKMQMQSAFPQMALSS